MADIREIHDRAKVIAAVRRRRAERDRPGRLARPAARLFDELVDAARLDPHLVVAEARRRDIPVTGGTLAEQVHSLRAQPPAALDPVADRFIATSAGLAGAQGLSANLAAVIALPVALPADTLGTLALTVRAVSGAMVAYGFDTETPDGALELRRGLALAAGVSSVTVRGQARVAIEKMLDPAVGTALGGQLSTALARAAGCRIGCALARSAVPRLILVAGGVAAAGINTALVHTTGRTAASHYRQQLVDWQRRHRDGASGPPGRRGDETTTTATPWAVLRRRWSLPSES